MVKGLCGQGDASAVLRLVVECSCLAAPYFICVRVIGKGPVGIEDGGGPGVLFGFLFV